MGAPAGVSGLWNGASHSDVGAPAGGASHSDVGAPAGGASHSDVGAPAGVSGGASHSDVGAPAGVSGSWSPSVSVMEVPTSSMHSNSTLLSLYSSLPVLFPSALYNLMLSAGMTVF